MVGDLHVVASWHRETTALKLIVIYVSENLNQGGDRLPVANCPTRPFY